MIIKGFWHIYLVNHWYSIVSDQLRTMINSGLYDLCEEINIGCIGFPEEKALLEKLFVNVYPKLNIKYYSQEPMDYEFPTIKLIEDDKSDYVGFYFHTKASTKPYDAIQNHWRVWLNESILNDWRKHCNNVSSNFDVSGVNHCLSPDHYSGNFWWFNSKYIKHLPKINTLNKSWRYHAEQWICMGKGRYFKGDFMEPGRDTFIMQHGL